MMIRLIYASRSVGINPTDVKSILASSRRNNQGNGVTGVLSLSNGIFLQCLEGERSVVNVLYHNILQDSRHKNPEVLSFEEITQRQFSSWDMGLITATNINAKLFLKYSPTAAFDPFRMPAEALQAFFVEILGNAHWLD